MNRRTFLTAAAAVLAVPFIGQRDDTACIQAQVNACAARGGGTVQLPPGPHRIAGIYMPPNVRLVG